MILTFGIPVAILIVIRIKMVRQFIISSTSGEWMVNQFPIRSTLESKKWYFGHKNPNILAKSLL